MVEPYTALYTGAGKGLSSYVSDAAGEVKGKIIGRMSESCDVEVPQPFLLVIFGASGDLAKRKIMPALYRLSNHGLLPQQYVVLGASRTDMSDEDFRELMRTAIQQYLPDDSPASSWDAFSKRLHYAVVDYAGGGSYVKLGERLAQLEKKYGPPAGRIYYLAVPPDVYEPIIFNLSQQGLTREDAQYRHVVIEKPIGTDLASAKKLNAVLSRSFSEQQVYRMDHYLAKENVQNILMFRFANSIFEPIWNRRYIDHVQITAAETLGVEHRAGYYERAGVLRDMFQNHLFQLLALTAMEPPAAFEAERVRDEKIKVFRSIRPFPLDRLREYVALGQYGRSTVEGKELTAYREDPGIAPDSLTPTYGALKVFIDDWRWNGVPFYLRSGKRLSQSKVEIAIRFKPVPQLMFASTMEDRIQANTLVLRVQPKEGINLSIETKNPGSRVCLNTVLMDFTYPKVFFLEPYERILLDCMQGDQMLFVRADDVEQTWTLLTPLIDAVESDTFGKGFPNYASGSSGPAEADELLGRDGRSWRAL
jgi:glucose-6-phosphate 1-dehydrogenase